MRIGMILDKAFPPDTRVENEAFILMENGFDVFLLSYASDREFDDKIKNLTVRQISKSRKWIRTGRPLISSMFDYYTSNWAKHIFHFVKDFNIEVLHVHDLYMMPAAIRIKKKTGVRLIVDLHENYPAAIQSYTWAMKLPNRLFVHPKKWERNERRYLAEADGIVVLSEFFKNQLLQKYSFLKPEQFIVYPNLPSLAEFRSYETDDSILNTDGKFTLFYFGAIGERRGIFTCFEALKELVDKIPEVLLLLIGPVDSNDQARFDYYLNDEKIRRHIIHYKWKDVKYLPSYIKKSDVCLSPIIKNDQHESGVANKVFQYMLFEKPLLVSNCIPQEKVVVDNQCGMSFRSEDVDDFVQKILELYRNRDLYESFSKNGRKIVEEKYCVESYKNHYLSEYEEVLDFE